MKRFAILCMILVLCLQVFSGTAAYGAPVEGDNIVVEGYSIGPATPVSEGKSCEITLRCSNTTSSAISNIYASVDSTSSFYGNPSNTLKVSNTLAGSASNQYLDNSLKLVYKGTGHELKLTLTYTIGGTEYSEDETVYISQVEPKDTGSGGSNSTADTSKYVPKLGTTSTNDIPTITAGSSTVVTYPVKNSSIYLARNITATLKMTDEAKAPLVLDNLDLKQTVDQINGNETQNISFKIGILTSAPDGLYALTLKYDCQNAYGDPPVSTSETVYIRVKNDSIGPRLVVDNVAVRKGTSPSQINLDIKLKNIGNYTAKDIKITLKGLKSNGFTTYNSTDIKYFTKIEGAAVQTVTYPLQLAESAAAGSNELSVKMDYKDASGTAYSEENQIFVPTGEDENSKPSIVFDKIVSPQGVLTSNKDFQVSMDLKNSGGAAAKNIKVTLTTDKEIITKSLSPIYIEKLEKDALKNVSFKLFATDEATTRNYPLAVNVEYEDLFGTKYTASQYIGVFVENGTAKTVPRIIVEKYSIDPQSVHAASDFTIKMSFLNTSSKTDVSNIKVSVTSDDGTFAPTDSGNTFFIDNIPMRQSVEKELMLHVKPDADQKSYVLSVNFEYEDNKGNPYTTKETMSVRVLQNPRLVTGELSLPPETFVGQPLQVYIDFYNMGKSTLYNMMVKAEGSFTGQGLSYYVGNFESGRTDSFDTSITPTSPGALKGDVVFSFEDANGKVTEIRKEFTVNVMDMPQQGPMVDENGIPIDKGGAVMVDGKPGNMPGMPGQKTSILIYAIPAAVVVLGIITFIVLRKRHKRRKEMSLDE